MKSRIMWSVVCIMLLCTSMSGFSQGIEFFKGTFNEALTKASNGVGLVNRWQKKFFRMKSWENT